MVLKPILLALLLLVELAVPATAEAHKGHHRNEATEVVSEQQPKQAETKAQPVRAAEREQPNEPLFSFARLADWLGRLHPAIIHFPLAFFPAALFTALVGRLRPAFGEPVRFLILAGGLTAPLAMLLGWLDAGWKLTDRDHLLFVHRWLGTAIGVTGLGLALWVLARPAAARGKAMLAALSLITVALLVQGWHGGAMVHGIDHLAW